MAKKVLKITGRVLLIILILILLFLIGTFIFDRISRSGEYELLKEKWYVNPVSVGDYSLNVYIYGSEAPKHTIVGMSGMGMDDFSCTARYVTDGLADDNRIVFVDRAGYGLSDDTAELQTVERMVTDYRTALKNAGIAAPYVLMPHSIAGPYAAYWASEYPDEIEGVFFLDGTQINGSDDEEDGRSAGLLENLFVVGSEIGLGRIYCELFEKDLKLFPKEEDLAVSQALYFCKGVFGRAKLSEEALYDENMRTAWDKIKANDVPKVYLCASYGMQTVEELKEMLDHYCEMTGEVIDMNEEKLKANLDAMIEFRHSHVDVFCEHVGNCNIELVPGDHIIYCHKPEKVRECLKKFLDGLDG